MATPPSTSDAALALLRALANEVKGAAHDPAMVHLVAQKLHKGIDALENALVGEQPKTKNDK